jgi:hypothetical protein
MMTGNMNRYPSAAQLYRKDAESIELATEAILACHDHYVYKATHDQRAKLIQPFALS